MQGYADRNEWRSFFSVIQAVYCLPTKSAAPLLSADGSTILTKKTQILQRWTEYFQGILNRPLNSDPAIARPPQVETNADPDLPPRPHETIKTVQHPSSGKAPGLQALRKPTHGSSDYALLEDAASKITHKVLFAYDHALNTTSEEDMQRSMDLFSATQENFGLIVKTERTVVMHQPPTNAASHNAPHIIVNGTHLQVMDDLTYRGRTISRSTKIDDEVARRIPKVTQPLGHL
nr:unnamed protein product [Spirometra erinaceieuropaei]